MLIAPDVTLTIELVPQTCWFSNVRSQVSQENWDILRKECYRLANHVCEICGGQGNKHPVECHEIWEYNDKKKLQTLKGLIALCPPCHTVKHIGYASVSGNYDKAVKQFMKVNQCTRKDAQDYIDSSFDTWRARSMHDWKLDLSWLDNKGIKYKKRS